MVIVTGSFLSFLREQATESWVPSSIVSWRIILAVCIRVRSSFLPVFSVSPGLSYPTLSLHCLGCCSLRCGAVWYHIVAGTVFTTWQLRAPLDHDVGFSEFLLWEGYAIVFFCG